MTPLKVDANIDIKFINMEYLISKNIFIAPFRSDN